MIIYSDVMVTKMVASRKKKPVVSVLLPVREGADRRWLKEAVDSIKKQTFRDFELLVGKDIERRGVTRTLNILTRRAKGEFLARMDADDISEPERLEIQVKYLRNNPRVQVVGSWATLIDERGKIVGEERKPTGWREIKSEVFSSNPLIHPSWMMRRQWFKKVRGYDDKYLVAQDWELVSRRVWKDRIENIPRFLVKLRLHRGSTSFRLNRKQVLTNLKIQWGMISRGNVSAWRVINLPPKLFAFLVPVQAKLLWRKLFMFENKPLDDYEQLTDNIELDGRGGKVDSKVLGIVLPMGQNRELLEGSGQWGLWKKELKLYKKSFLKVEWFEYSQTGLFRYLEAVLLPFNQQERFGRCSILKAVHLTGVVPCLVAKWRYQIPYGLSFGYRYDRFAWVEGKLFKWLLAKMLIPLAVKKAAVVMVPTRKLKKYVSGLGVRRVEMIPNGVDTKIFQPQGSKTKVQKLGKNLIRVLFVGRLERQKNLLELVRAVALVERRVRIVIVGEGSLKNKIERLAEELKVEIDMVGVVENEKLPRWYRRADIFVLPSLVEGHPKVLLEAMSCALPVVASNIPGVQDIIKDGSNGLLVDSTAMGLLTGLEKLVEDFRLRKKLGREARKTVLDKFEKQKLMRKEIQLLKQESLS